MSNKSEYESDPFVIRSKVRASCKWDFMFAMKYQSELGSSSPSMGRTRSKTQISNTRQHPDVGPSSKVSIFIGGEEMGSKMTKMPSSMKKLLSSGLVNGKRVKCRTDFEEESF